MSTPAHSVVVIGATGRIGQAVLKAFQSRSSDIASHAFVRTPSKLPPELSQGCASVIKGDGRDADAVHRALDDAEATDAVLCTGFPNGLTATDVRAATGRALADAVTARLEQSGRTTRVVVVSALGAGGSTIRFGWGIGTVVSTVIGLQLKDHDGQERALQDAFADRPHELLIARPVGLTDGEPVGSVRVHDGEDAVSLTVNRVDLADWIADQIAGEGEWFGKTPAIYS